MNKRMIFFMLGRIILLESILLLLPLGCALIYKEDCFWAFAITIAVGIAFSFILSFLNKPQDKNIYAKEGLVIVSLAWIALSAIGALPFYISREIPSYVDAFFETVSGFTTTGASILTDVESMSKGLLFWRSFTHWIGGMGVLVLLMAIFPTDSGRSMHIMRAEMPGPIVGKLVPRIKSTARVLYLIYMALTAIQIVMLLLGGMPVFESVIYSLGTAGTGGFGINADSLASYSAYSQWVITIFMLIFGVNFNLYYLILVRKTKNALKSEELWLYLGLAVASTGIIAYDIYSVYGMDSIRQSAFQVASIMSTTGYATADFNLWSPLSKGILFLLMFVGACAGSTAGGIKVSRIILIFKSIRSNLRHVIHSRSVQSVRFEGKKIENQTTSNTLAYLALYFLCFGIIFFIISFDRFDIETNISAVAACINNVGPGFSAVGPASSYSQYSDISKILLSYSMLLGRLELYPMLLLFAPSVWKGRAVKVKK